jgi:HEAT repeat protein
MPALVRLLAALLAASALLLSGGCGDDEKDASARIERLRASGNAEGLGREAASTDAAAAAEAVRALGRLGQKAWPQVEAALRDSRREVRQEAAAIYPLVAPAGDAAPEMAALVRSDPEPTVRATAVTALGHVRALDEMDAVLAALDDADPLVRQRALDAVERIMGKRYDLGQTPEERSRRAAQVRADWVAQQTFIRDYYRTRRPAAK